MTFVVRRNELLRSSFSARRSPLESRILSHDSDVSTFVQIDGKRYEATCER